MPAHRHPKADEIARRVAAGERPRDVSRILGVAPSVVYAACQRAGVEYRRQSPIAAYRRSDLWPVGKTPILAALTEDQIREMFGRHRKAPTVLHAILADLFAYWRQLHEDANCPPAVFRSRREPPEPEPVPIFKSTRARRKPTHAANPAHRPTPPRSP